jgi:queuine tRNA-ribosyltransferase
VTTGDGCPLAPRAGESGGFRFEVGAADAASAARGGRLCTGHGDVETPVFMPVGTAGTVKALTWEAVWDTGCRLILGNTYHLYLRPGNELIARLGGLHRFAGWPGGILTDSAGFQIFSLAKLNRVSDEGVVFQSHLDGSRHFFTPELSMAVQQALGADIVMAFDHCLPHGADAGAVAAAVDRTTAWAVRCRAALAAAASAGRPGVLFGIVQGSTLAAQRRRSAAALRELDLPGYAIGGLSVGESKQELREMTALTAELLPLDRPRYLMGVGFPDDILQAVAAGVDMFDCVLPTRMGRTGTALTRDGRLVLRNEKYARDERPLDPDCRCPVCLRHSRAYLRHLFQAREILGAVLATMHNLHFYQDLMQGIRDAIRADRFGEYARRTQARWQSGEEVRLREIAGRDEGPDRGASGGGGEGRAGGCPGE